MPDPSTALVTVNGIPFPARSAQRIESLVFGEEARAASGSDLTSIRAVKEGWKFQSAPMFHGDAYRWRGLLGPNVYSWSFDVDQYADLTGLGPTSMTGATIQSTNKKFGANALKVDRATNFTLADFSAGLNGANLVRNTLMWWSLRGATWEHWINVNTRLESGSWSQRYYRNGSITYVDSPGSGSDVAGSSQTRSVGIYFSSGAVGFFTPNFTAWATGVSISQGNFRRSTNGSPNAGAHWFRANNAGTTHATTEPTWNTTVDSITTDNGINWQCCGTTDFYIDDVVALPFDILTEGGDFMASGVTPANSFANGWVDYLWTFVNRGASSPWPPSPRLQLAGDVTRNMTKLSGQGEGYASVYGKVLGAEIIRGYVGYPLKNLSGTSLTGQKLRKANEILEVEFREA